MNHDGAEPDHSTLSVRERESNPSKRTQNRQDLSLLGDLLRLPALTMRAVASDAEPR